MYTPRSFSLFVTAAFAALSSCAPIGGLPTDIVPGSALPVGLPKLPVGGLPALPAGLPGLPNLPLPRQVGDLDLEDLESHIALRQAGGLPALPVDLSDLPKLPLPRQIGDLGDLESDIAPRQVGGLDAGGLLGGVIAGKAIPGPSELTDNLRRHAGHVEHPSLPEVFHGLAVKLTPVCDKLKAAVSLKAELDVEVVVGLLEDVIAILAEAIVLVQFIVDHPTEFVLSLAGTILSITQVAELVAAVLALVIPVLGLVVAAVTAVGATAAGVVLPVVAVVGAHIATLLALVFIVVPTLLAALLPLISGLVSTIYYLSIAQLVGILGLPALSA